LQAMSGTLEARVADRTSDLALAAEIGNTISQVRQLDSLLAEAAELIRARFDLYYVQIYLADAAGNNLELRVGTGSIGRALVAKGHRLLLGSGSINGLAATNKRAVVVADTKNSPIFFANRLLPDTRSELAVPLLIADRVVGVLDLQSDQVNALTRESLATFDALAGQLAVAIENASLFTEVTEARKELERHAVAQTRADWVEFLDAIHRREQFGFVYQTSQASAVTKSIKTGGNEQRMSAPISITGASVGTIDLERVTGEIWTEADIDMVSAISGEVAQKIENLRLLAEAEQYRWEAEDAARRLVREGWQKFAEASPSVVSGYTYDRDQVVPVSLQNDDANARMIRRQLVVGGETIGYLDVADADGNPEQTTSLADAVAQQLSARIENLRLSEQTEQALTTTEEQARRLALLNEMSEALNRAATISDIFDIAVAHTAQILAVDQATLAMLISTGDAVEVRAIAGEASSANAGEQHAIVAGSPLFTAIHEKRLVTDAHGNDAGQISMIAPLMGEQDVFGTLSVSSERPTNYTANDEVLMLQIAAVLGATIERRRLADQAQARADRERILRQITARVHAAADAQSVLRTAAQEVNRALGLESFVYLEAESSGLEQVPSETNGEHG
jgi:GAF domain-containing protein